MLLRKKVYYYTDRQKALHSEGTHKLLHMREDKIMDNENKNKLSEKQLAQVSGGDIPNFPCSYGEQICPVCGSTDVQYAYDDIGDDGYGKVDSEVWICHSCNNHFVRIAFDF